VSRRRASCHCERELDEKAGLEVGRAWVRRWKGMEAEGGRKEFQQEDARYRQRERREGTRESGWGSRLDDK
jgi:hypothetical protein